MWPGPFTDDDLEKIEAKMKEITSQKLRFSRQDVSRDEAINFFSGLGEKYKVELLEEFTDPVVSYYQQENSSTLERSSPSSHRLSQGFQAHKRCGGLLARRSSINPMLQRIYGTAFFDKESLKKYLTFLEEAPESAITGDWERNWSCSVSRMKLAPEWLFITQGGR